MTTHLDLSDAEIADLVVQTPLTVTVLLLTLLDVIVQQKQPSRAQLSSTALQ
jgi:hypothetical protein